MYAHNLIFISNDFKFDKKYFDDYLKDPENGIYPFKLEDSETNMIKDFKQLYPNSMIVDMYQLLAKPIYNLFLRNYNNIDKSKISKENLGALLNLNPQFLPEQYFKHKLLNEEYPFDLSNAIIYERFLKEKYVFFKKHFYTDFILNLEPEISGIISFYDSKYDNVAKSVFHDFYDYIILDLFPKYSDPDSFWKFVYILRDHILPRLFDCFISVLISYDSRYFTTKILQSILVNLDDMSYSEPFYSIHNMREKVLIRDWIIVNSFLDLRAIKHEDLFSITDNVMLIKATNLDKYSSMIFPKLNEPLPGFCSQLYNYYYRFNLFDIYIPYNSKGVSDYINLDKVKTFTDTSLRYINYQKCNNEHIKYRGIIEQDSENDNRLTHYQVVDNLDDISKLDLSLDYFKGHKYLMLDSPTRDDIKDYVDNNNVTKFELYLDFNKLNIDLTNSDDIDYLNSLKEHNCLIACLISDEYIQSIEQYNLMLKNVSNICILKSCDTLTLYKKPDTFYRCETCITKSNSCDYTYYQMIVKTLLNDNYYEHIYFY